MKKKFPYKLEGKEAEESSKTMIKAGKSKKAAFYDFGCHTCKKNLNDKECEGVDPSKCISKFYSFHENKDNLSEEIKQSIEKGKKFIKDFHYNAKNNIENVHFPGMPWMNIPAELTIYEDSED